MSFSFGSPPAAAPASSGFSFGGTAPSTNPAPAPTTFGFGNTTPSAPSFGTAAPTAAATTNTGFTFGTSTSSSSSQPAPASAFSFGSPAPSTSLFGSSTAPANATSGMFGSLPPAPAPLFGQPQQQPQQQQQQQQQQQPQQQYTNGMIAGNMSYSSLSPQYRQAIDDIYKAIMEHKRTMTQVQSTQPHVLLVRSGTDGPSQQTVTTTANKHHALIAPATLDTAVTCPLSRDIARVQQQLQQLSTLLQTLDEQSQFAKSVGESLVTQVTMFGKWPLEAVAVRRGMRLYDTEEKKEESLDTNNFAASQDKNNPATSSLFSSLDSNTSKLQKQQLQARMRELLDRQMAVVDRVEAMPSPFFMQMLDDMQQRLSSLSDQATSLQQAIAAMKTGNNMILPRDGQEFTSIVETQHRLLWQMGQRIAEIHNQMQSIRVKYRLMETGENVLDQADREEQERLRRREERIQLQYIQASTQQQQPQQNQGQQPFASTPSFGFGGTASTPAPSTGFSFSNPAPAPFGSTPAPSSGTFSLSATPSPAPAASSTGFSFASANPATAPAPFSFASSTPAPSTSFSSASSLSRKKGTPSRRTSRLGR